MTKHPTILADTVIPGTTNSYGEARHVRKAYGAAVQPGTLLARQGAWQHKRVVTNVVYGGVVETQHGPRHAFTITVQPLGQLFADGRMQPTPWGHKVKDLYVEVEGDSVCHYDLSGWRVVECFAPKPPKALVSGKYVGSGTGYVPPANHPLQGPDVPVGLPTMAKVKHAHKSQPKAEPAPEAVLAQFLIPACGLAAFQQQAGSAN